MGYTTPQPPNPPESRVEHKGKFYTQSQFNKYKGSFQYKWVWVIECSLLILFILAVIGLSLMSKYYQSTYNMIKFEYENKMHVPNVKDKCTLSNGYKFSISDVMNNSESFEKLCSEPNIIEHLSHLRKFAKDKQAIENLLTKAAKYLST